MFEQLEKMLSEALMAAEQWEEVKKILSNTTDAGLASIISMAIEYGAKRNNVSPKEYAVKIAAGVYAVSDMHSELEKDEEVKED